MAVKIADAVIPLILDLSQFDQQMAAVEARIAGAQAQASAAASAASSAAASASAGGGGGGGGGTGGFWGQVGSLASTVGSLIPGPWGRAAAGAGAVLDAVDINAASEAYKRGDWGGMAGAVNMNAVGDALIAGATKGIGAGKGEMSAAMAKAVEETIDAGKKAAEVGSPSRKSAREIGGPIMQGVEVGIQSGTAGVTNAMVNSLMFSFGAWKAALGGGTFVGPGLNVVGNAGGTAGGIGDWLGMLGGSIQNSMDIGAPTSGLMGSRVLMSNIPLGLRNMGQDLLSGALGSVLPGWAAGPLSDMIGTATGLKPVLGREAITAPGVMAGSGGFADYPYGGGSIFNTTNYFSGGNFTDVERQVQIGILQSARRLGVYI
jgi:trimeric autotransporter adhesin